MKYLLAVIMIALASPLYANPVFEKYVQWIVENSRFEYNGEALPTVKRIPKDWMQIYAYGDQAVAEAERKGQELPKIHALYDETTDEIILPKDFDLNNFERHHIIVHELVHYLQDINGDFESQQAKDCIQSLEPEAYKLHGEWMDQVNHPAERPNDLFILMMEMSCRDHHGAGGG
jgi:hypothetical protein